MSERPLAEQLARDVLRDPVTYGWLAPLAREYLKEIAPDPTPALCGEHGRAMPDGAKP